MSKKSQGNRARIARLTAFVDALTARANTLAGGGYTDRNDEHDRIVRDATRQMSELDFLKHTEMTFDSSSEEDLPWAE